MMNINKMFEYLQQNLISHTVKIEDNKIKAKKKHNWGRFLNFTLTYLKNNEVSLSLSVPSKTRRYNSNTDLFRDLGAFASVEYKGEK